MMRCIRLASLALCGALISFNAAAEDMSTDANIITGLDVSSSINAQETMLQIEGMAQAIRSPAVLAAIQHGQSGRIGFAVFVWADGDYPELVSWRAIGSAEEAEAASQEITSRLQEVMTRAFNRVWAAADKEETDLRTAALMEGIRRVAEGYRVRGLYP